MRHSLLLVVAIAMGCVDRTEWVSRNDVETLRAMDALDEGTVAIRDAIVRGDLYDARRRAGMLGTGLPPLPDGAPGAEQALRLALSEIRTASSLAQAASALSRTASVCSTCHAATDASVTRPPWISVHDTRDPLDSEMARHAMLVDGLWLGMIAPSDAELRGALEVLERASGDLPAPERLASADQRVHDLASTLVSAPQGDRAPLYAGLLMACAGCHSGARPPQVPQFDGVPMPHLQGAMMDHFVDALDLQLWVMGGDLDRARVAAVRLETGTFGGLPPRAEPFVEGIRAAAGRAARAKTISTAATASAEVALACGGCHIATGGGPTDTMEVPAAEPHMALHVYAAYWMGYGIIAADEGAWTKSAEVLATAPLSVGATRPVAGADAAVHALAAKAGRTADWPARAAVWGEILAECAVCHQQIAP